MSLPPEQRTALLAAKLRALVTNEELPWRRVASALHFEPFGAGAGLVDADTSTGWLLVAPRVVPSHIDAMPDPDVDPNPHGWLGGAVAWSQKRSITSVHILLDEYTRHDARRALVFTNPPTLWGIVGRAVLEITPEPFDDQLVSEDQLHEFSPKIIEAGAEVVIDHGVIRAEVLGLEVGRVIVGEDGIARFDVGVGRHDRLANAMLGNDRDTVASLRSACEEVRMRRTPDAGPHPANQLSRERWLRDIVRAKPSLAGVVGPLQPIASARPAALKQLGPALLVNTDLTAVVACSVGLDLDALVDAAEVRNRVAPNARVVLVLPEQDAVPSQRELLDSIPNSALAPVPNSWQSL